MKSSLFFARRDSTPSHAQAVALFRPLLLLDGVKIRRKAIYVQAMRLFEDDPQLDFTDCLLAVYAREDNHELVTLDRRLARTAGVEVLAR